MQKVNLIHYYPEDIDAKINALKKEINEYNKPIKKYNKKISILTFIAAAFMMMIGASLLFYYLFFNDSGLTGCVGGIAIPFSIILAKLLPLFLEKEKRKFAYESTYAMNLHLAIKDNSDFILACNQYDAEDAKKVVCLMYVDEAGCIDTEIFAFDSCESEEIKEIALDMEKELLFFPK